MTLKAERQAYDRNDRDQGAKSFYSSVAWLRCRDAYLEAHLICARCEAKGLLVRAEIVHHIIAIKAGGKRLSWSNLQSFCAPCHSAKSITDGDRYGRRPRYETRE